MPSKFKDQIFEFAHERMGFVDAEIKLGGKTKPRKAMSENKTEAPFIFDKKRGFEDRAEYREYPLNETGAFILHFVMEKIPCDLIAQIFKSQYGGSVEAATVTVDGFIEELLQKELLKPAGRPLRRRAAPKPQVSPPEQFLGLHLNFSMGLNPMNYYKIKYPT